MDEVYGVISRRSLLKYSLWGLATSQLGCRPNARDNESTKASRLEAPKNCLFMVLDAAAARHFSAWGYGRDTTPNIDSLALGSFVFRNAFSQASATVPSVRSYFSGRYPNEVRVQLLRSEFTMADAFRHNSFRTALFSENPHITRTFNYNKGFDVEFSYFTHKAQQQHKQTRSDVELESEKMHSDARAWISSVGDSPWFCYIHHLRPHAPYHSPKPFTGRFSQGLPRGRATGSAYRMRELETAATPEEAEYLAALYDENLNYCDDLIGRLVDWLETTKRLDDTLIIIASDHGEAFMQHGWLQHATTTYDEMIHVPLIFRFPPPSGIASGESSAQVEMLDLFPTLASVFGFAAVPTLDGQSLLPLLTGVTKVHKDYVFTLAPRNAHQSFAVRTPERKYIVKLDRSGQDVKKRELYDLEADPLESSSLLSDGEVSDVLEILLTTRFPRLLGSANPLVAPSFNSPEVEERTREALEALGYIN